MMSSVLPATVGPCSCAKAETRGPFASRLDLSTGRKRPWMELGPSDLAGAKPPTANNIALTADGRHGVYQLHRMLARLYLVEGLR